MFKLIKIFNATIIPIAIVGTIGGMKYTKTTFTYKSQPTLEKIGIVGLGGVCSLYLSGCWPISFPIGFCIYKLLNYESKK